MPGEAPAKRKGADKRGRPTLLTPETEQLLLNLVRYGRPPAKAARALGLEPDTVSKWLRRGQAELKAGKKGSKYIRFFRNVRKAREAAIFDLVKIVQDAARGGEKRTLKNGRVITSKPNPTHAKWLIERMERKTYGPPTPVAPWVRPPKEEIATGASAPALVEVTLEPPCDEEIAEGEEAPADVPELTAGDAEAPDVQGEA